MKILFLDIDGVLNSERTNIAFGGFPHGTRSLALFDIVALRMIQRMCKTADVKVVLSSSWRIIHTVEEMSELLNLPIIDATPNGAGPRGAQIATWLAHHPEVTAYAIVDDSTDMLDGQLPYFIKTDPYDGLSWADFSALCNLFGISPYDGEAPQYDPT